MNRDPCDIHPEQLSALVDGELSPAEELAVRRHLAGCRRCAEGLATLDAVRGAVAAMADVVPEDPATEADLDDLRRRLSTPPTPAPADSGRAPWLGRAAAAVAAALALAVIVWTADDRPTPRGSAEGRTGLAPAPASIESVDGLAFGGGGGGDIGDGDTPCGSPETCGPSARPLALDPDF